MRHALLAIPVVLVILVGALPAQTPDFYDLDTVRTLYFTFKQPNWWAQLEANYGKEIDIEADLLVDGKNYPRVGVRFRGNTSYRRLPTGSQKKGLNVTTDSFVAGQRLLGYDSLNLNNGFHDPTFVREVITYQIMRRYGLAPKANFVKVYLNNVYWGIYINVQQPEGTMMGEWFSDDEGNRYRGFPSSGPHSNSALIYLGSTVSPYQVAYDFKKGDGTDLLKMISVLNLTATNQLQTELPKVWSVDQGFWYCIVMNALMQTDSYIGSGKDHFLYVDNEHGQFHMFPFDVNEALGAEGRPNSSLSPFYNSTSSGKPALSKTLQFSDWRARYVAHYRTVVEESVSWTEIGKLVTKYQSMIAKDVAADTKKIYTTAQFTDNVTRDVRVSSRETIAGLKPLVEARRKYLDTVPEFLATRPTLSDLKHTPAVPQPTETVYVTARASTTAAKVTLHYRIKGPYLATAMLDDGKHGDGQASDGVYGAAIAPQKETTIVDYYVSASTSAGVMRFLPKNAEFLAPSYQVNWPISVSPIKLNEFVAKNVAGIKDEKSEPEDWIELINTGTAAVDVSGWYLTDKTDNPTKWALPANTVIQPGKTLLVWCDDEITQGPLHAAFKLSSGGESILLFAKDGKTMYDRIDFGPQAADVSTGRMMGSSTRWATFPTPTPLSENRATPFGHLAYGWLDTLTPPAALLAGSGTPSVGGQAIYSVSNAPANAAAHLGLATSPFTANLGALGTLLVLPVHTLPFSTDGAGAGAVKIAIPNASLLAGQSFFFQVLVHDGTTGGLTHAIVTTIGP